MSQRQTTYVAPKPPEGAQKLKINVFLKKYTFLEESLLQGFFV